MIDTWIVGGLGALIVLAVLWPLLRRVIWNLFGLQERMDRVLSQKKSSEVRLGKIAETMAPLMDDFPVAVGEPGSATIFLGQPIDYVHFDPDGSVTLIEVKSGAADLSPFQRSIRRAVEEGRVSWVSHRVDGRKKRSSRS